MNNKKKMTLSSQALSNWDYRYTLFYLNCNNLSFINSSGVCSIALIPEGGILYYNY
jgi:hypothetical protein